MLVNLTVKVFEDIENYFLYTGFLLQKFTHRMDCESRPHKHMRFYALLQGLLPPAKTFPLPEGVLNVL